MIPTARSRDFGETIVSNAPSREGLVLLVLCGNSEIHPVGVAPFLVDNHPVRRVRGKHGAGWRGKRVERIIRETGWIGEIGDESARFARAVVGLDGRDEVGNAWQRGIITQAYLDRGERVSAGTGARDKALRLDGP